MIRSKSNIQEPYVERPKYRSKVQQIRAWVARQSFEPSVQDVARYVRRNMRKLDADAQANVITLYLGGTI